MPSEPDPLWQQMLQRLPMGVALLELRTGQTCWVNDLMQVLLKDGVGVSNPVGRMPLEYMPGLEAHDWNAIIEPLRAGKTRETALPQRLKLVHEKSRLIAYWEWMVQAVGGEYLMLTIQSVSDVVLKEKQLVSAGRTALRARQRAEALTRLTQHINAAITPAEMLRIITQQASAYFDSSHAAVLLLDASEEHFRIGAGIGLQPTPPDYTLPRAQTLAGQALDTRKTRVLVSLEEQEVMVPLLDNGRPPAALVTSPIWQGEKAYGVVEVYFTQSRDIPEDARELLAAFADQTAIALQKADLYTQFAEQRRRLQSIFDNAPVGIIYFDMSGTAVAVNAAASVRYGRTPEEMIGCHYTQFLDEILIGLFEQVQQGTPFHASHFVYRLPDGAEMVCDLSLLPVRDEQGEVVGLLKLSFDVTDLVTARQEADNARHAAEHLLAQVQAAQSQMVQMEKMRAIGELASGVAHDFNNALMAILGYTELAEESLDDPETLESHLAIIRKAAEDASTTVQRLQSFAKQRTVAHGVQADLNLIVQDVVKMTRPIWKDAAQKEGRVYEVQLLLHTIPLVYAEPSGLREVLINMVHNAINAMPTGGLLCLATRMHGENEVEIEISDTGVGMTPEVVSRIFDPFFTTRGVEGTGLGLAVSWTIIQRHGGTIDVQSAPGKGTRFYLRLPIGEKGTERVTTSRATSPALPVQGIPILVVDDEPFVAGVLTTILSKNGYHVTTVYSAKAALEELEESAHPFQIVLTDHGMPGMTGLQLLAEIKRRWPEMPVVLLTGWGETVLQTHIAETLPDAVLGKPINQVDLLSAVGAALRNHGEPHKATESS